MSDLTERMRRTATELVEFTEEWERRTGCRWEILTRWSPDSLRHYADRWEAEDAEGMAKSTEIAQLAQDLATSAGYANPDQLALQRAADLYAMGYRKGGAS